jgi:uncharacterized protein (TIGR02646 family)
MIRINKSNNLPIKLSGDGRAVNQTNKQLFDADPANYLNGNLKFEFKSSIYGHPSVKDQLIEEQHGKCCFCESDFRANGYGDVEHFRPKGGFQQRKNDRVIKSGYFWLAYDWGNLFFSCQICNQRFKKNYFPLENENFRARSHHENINNEQCLLINPSIDNPENHISFHRGSEIPHSKDDKGSKSISGFGLKRENLNKVRRKYLHNFTTSLKWSRIDVDQLSEPSKIEIIGMLGMSEVEFRRLIQEAITFINLVTSEKGQFLNMIKSNFPELFNN